MTTASHLYGEATLYQRDETARLMPSIVLKSIARLKQETAFNNADASAN